MFAELPSHPNEVWNALFCKFQLFQKISISYFYIDKINVQSHFSKFLL